MKVYEYILKIKEQGTDKLARIKQAASGAGRSLDRTQGSTDRLTRSKGRLNRKSQDTINKLNKISSSGKKSSSSMEQASKSSDKLSSSLGGLKRIAATVFTVAAIGGFSAQASNLASSMEQSKVTFETILGSAKEAEGTINRLNQFANATPFTNGQVVTSGRNLLAFGVENDKLLATLRNIGDVASGLNIPFNELSEIYGKIKVQNTVFSEDLNQLAGRGIPIFDELAKVIGVAPNQIKKLASQSKITFPFIERAFKNMTGEGGKFFNLMAKQSQTFGGKTSTIQGKMELAAIGFGESINRFMAPALNDTIRLLDKVIEAQKPVNQQYLEQKERVDKLVSSSGPLISRYKELISSSNLTNKEQAELKTVTKQLADILPSAVSKWDKYGNAIQLSADKLGNLITKNKEAVKLLNAEAISAEQKKLFNLQRDAINLRGNLEQISRTGTLAAAQGGALGLQSRVVSEEQIRAIRDRLKGISGKDGLIQQTQAKIRELSGKKSVEQLRNEIFGLSSSGANSEDNKGKKSGESFNLKAGINKITGGGQRAVSVNVSGVKFIDGDFILKTETLDKGVEEVEEIMRQMWARILNAGIRSARQ